MRSHRRTLKSRLIRHNDYTARAPVADDIARLIQESVPSGTHCGLGPDICPQCARRDQADLCVLIALRVKKWLPEDAPDEERADGRDAQ